MITLAYDGNIQSRDQYENFSKFEGMFGKYRQEENNNKEKENERGELNVTIFLYRILTYVARDNPCCQ